ncbi:MAG: DUF4292 domain-containing protein [Paludibacteraceae bacterium]|nr:DUF4292 domain-containing protein [Paludibacteraceae bacterium]
MKSASHIYPLFIALCAVLLCASCAGTRRTARQTRNAPTWHTMETQGVATLSPEQDKEYKANYRAQVVNDSLVVVSVMPVLGIELMRLEATPDDILLIDKLNHRYCRLTYKETAEFFGTKLTYNHLQGLATGQSAKEKDGSFHYDYTVRMGKRYHLVCLRLTYASVKKDTPLRISTIDLKRYTQVTPQALLTL